MIFRRCLPMTRPAASMSMSKTTGATAGANSARGAAPTWILSAVLLSAVASCKHFAPPNESATPEAPKSGGESRPLSAISCKTSWTPEMAASVCSKVPLTDRGCAANAGNTSRLNSSSAPEVRLNSLMRWPFVPITTGAVATGTRSTKSPGSSSPAPKAWRRPWSTWQHACRSPSAESAEIVATWSLRVGTSPSADTPTASTS
mmetsp:Transcript_57590/g.160413  ORF Transcript_57590/g.160413 Transcript_57590/m.160413 type:complete len:203 (+) Transcript_57590:955-1563(+)